MMPWSTMLDSEDILQQLCTSVVERTTPQEKDIIDNQLKAFQTSWFPAMRGTCPDGIGIDHKVAIHSHTPPDGRQMRLWLNFLIKREVP
mmetsp:Transcript_13631/g.11627  ORF Transcript_13631/g.11627 Transcript_13631/m.11627 type:complete len:89 (-) Transcript_13631:141-407(-)